MSFNLLIVYGLMLLSQKYYGDEFLVKSREDMFSIQAPVHSSPKPCSLSMGSSLITKTYILKHMGPKV